MVISSLQLTNFRSYDEHSVELNRVVTLVVGRNATGKTNLLEALFVLATTRSFRAKDAELIKHGEEFYRIAAKTASADLALSYQNKAGITEKRVRHDDTLKSLVDHLGTLRVVLFEPGDNLIITGAPDRRRRYLDFILTQTDKQFVKTLSAYRRVLAQRNRLLADGRSGELFAWNLQLSELAAEIDARRRALVDHINTLAEGRYKDIAGSPAPLLLEYRGAVEAANYESTFLQALDDNLGRDLGAGFTTIGPHRDDFDISFKDADIKAVASRGEMRTVVLALKMAELAYMQQHTGTKPLLLLDDVFSELDDVRRKYLLDTLGGYQSLVTTTNADVGEELSATHATIYTEDV